MLPDFGPVRRSVEMLKQLQMGMRAFLLMASRVWTCVFFLLKKQVRAVSRCFAPLSAFFAFTIFITQRLFDTVSISLLNMLILVFSFAMIFLSIPINIYYDQLLQCTTAKYPFRWKYFVWLKVFHFSLILLFSSFTVNSKTYATSLIITIFWSDIWSYSFAYSIPCHY